MSAFWAKTGSSGEWLSLDRHLDDVAAVAERLWGLALTERQRAWITRSCRVDATTMRSWWIFLAGIHDVGKASPAFQGLVPDLARRVVSDDLSLDRPAGSPIRHDQVSGAILVHTWGPVWAPLIEAETWDWLAAAISGHHGVLRSRDALDAARRRVLWSAPAWAAAQRALLDARADRLCLDRQAVPRPRDPAVVLALAGLLTVSDWIGSDQRRFPVTAGNGRALASKLAKRAVTDAAWTPVTTPRGRTFAKVFVDREGRPATPRPSQQAVIDALVERDGPTLLVVEDRTGAGKTESALWAAYRGLENGARGIYVGMPTRATANQLHQRTEAFLRRALGDEHARARLLHSGIEAADAATDEEPQPSGIGDSIEGTGRNAAVEADARAWFLDRRRGLLERFGVGTIDQALLSVLAARHFSVRLWGLQGKTVIFDEVHAYDTYTGTLLDRALAWLAALDCSVVLLSATLPPSRREQLVAAYRGGRSPGKLDRPSRRRARGRAITVDDAPYPRLTIVDDDGSETVAVDDPRPSRTVALERLEIDRDDDGVAIASLVEAETDGGGCVAVVCNTVALAQQRTAAIRAQLGDGVEVLLLHARLRPVEREPLERRMMDALGPAARTGRGRPERLVVIATQVIEQSLDIDFDVMLTDVAPIDLLVQRAGRVHRHEREGRADQHATARLVVLDTAGGGITRPYVAGNDRIYAAPVLHRTRALLASCQSITEPDDLDRMVRAVYEGTPTLDSEEQAAYEHAVARMREQERRYEAHAEQALVPPPWADDPPWELLDAPFADAEAPGATVRNAAATRWVTDPSVGVVVLGPGELAEVGSVPSIDEARELLRRAVSLRATSLGVQLDPSRRSPGLGLPWQPGGWRKHPLLRHHLLVRTDPDGRALPPDDARDALPLPLRWMPQDGVLTSRSTTKEERTCAST